MEEKDNSDYLRSVDLFWGRQVPYSDMLPVK